MSDTATTEMPPEVKEELDKIVTTTKRGFDVEARVKNRGLRKGSITLYLDEELSAKLGWAEDVRDGLGSVIGRSREGVNGELDAAQMERTKLVGDLEAYRNAAKVTAPPDLAAVEKTMQSAIELADGRIAELEAQRDEMIAEMSTKSIVINMRAVPPILVKDCRRLARQTIGIETKGVPENLQDEYELARIAHMMTLMFQSVTDTETGAVNTETIYDDGIALMDYLPPDQFTRLDLMMGKVQYTDSISRAIEQQEDFS